jgi:phosphoribosylamine--glycine ligase
MRVLLIDTSSNFLAFAMRCQAAGHDVLWWDEPRKNGTPRMAGRGIIPKITDYALIQSKFLDWADVVLIADNAKYTGMLEPYILKGYPIISPTRETADWELDRSLGQQVMKRAGLNIIPGVEFHDYEEAAAFVQSPEGRGFLVSKPSGDADKALSYVAPNRKSLLYMFDRWRANEKYASDAKKHGFILQEKKRGCEIAVGGWFGSAGWAPWWYENFEHKKLMACDLGPNTGEMGTLSMYVAKSKLADMALKPVTAALRAAGYVGFVDIAGMVDKAGEFWPFEWTMRPGWPTFHNQVATHEGDPVEWMVDLLHGKNTLRVKENVACVTVVMAIPDFPYSKATLKEVSDIPVYLNDADPDALFLSEVQYGETYEEVGGRVIKAPGLMSSGDYITVVAGLGDTITGARRSAYATVKKIEMPADPFYRPDIAQWKMKERLELAQKHGFAKGFRI